MMFYFEMEHPWITRKKHKPRPPGLYYSKVLTGTSLVPSQARRIWTEDDGVVKYLKAANKYDEVDMKEFTWVVLNAKNIWDYI